MSAIRLNYFDMHGRGDPIRFLLTHAKVEFEDNRINGEQFVELKAAGKLEFNQVPSLEIDGHILVQSCAILRYLGKKYGYYPDEPTAMWKVDSLLDAAEDFYAKYNAAFWQKDEEIKKAKLADLLNWLPGWINAIEKRIEANEDPHYAVGNKRTIADFALATISFSFINNEAGQFHADLAPLTKKEDHPVLTKYLTNLHGELKDYLASRPQPRTF